MNNVFGIIFAADQERLDNLTNLRTTASVPFGGRYRCIDFALSNFVNSQITNIGIITRNNYSSLMDHIRMGRDWDLNRKNGGITVFPPYAQATSNSIFKDKIDAIYGIQNYIREKVKEEYVVITNSNIVANIDFTEYLDKHIKTGADITILTHMARTTKAKRLAVEKDKNNKVTSVRITRTSDDEEKEVGISTYIIKKDLLMKLVIDNTESGNYDFEKNIIQDNLNTLKIYAYLVEGHCAIIDDIKTYYKENMSLLDQKLRDSLFDGQGGLIYTRVKDSVPTRYRDNATVSNSLVADGCDINGTVENSILFRGVVIEEGAVVKNSIIMEGGIVKKNAKILNAITDKDVVVLEGSELSSTENYPIVISKGKTV